MVKKFSDNEFEPHNGDETGAGGDNAGSSGIAFYFDPLAGERRDDLLAPEDMARLLKVHTELHYELVKKQKIERKNRSELKDGKRPAMQGTSMQGTYPGQYGQGMDNGFKTHPITAKAYFSGIDRQVIGIASENVADTNPDRKNELEQRLELKNRLQHTHTPKFNPTPRPT